MASAQEYLSERKAINNVPVIVATYRIGDMCYCHISNVDPGATIARAAGKTKEEAVNIAEQKAAERIKPLVTTN